MYFSDALRVLARRWYVLLAGLLLVGVANALVTVLVPTNYQASANVLFLLPPTASGDKPVNPYLNTPQGLVLTSAIVGGVVSTPEEQRNMFASGFTSDYAVSQTPGTGFPLLAISVQDSNPTMAVRTLKEVIRRVDAELSRMQVAANAPVSQRIMASTFSVTDQAEPLHGAKIRAIAIVAGVGIVLTALAAFVLDGASRRRARRSAATREAGGPVRERLLEDDSDVESLSGEAAIARRQSSHVGEHRPQHHRSRLTEPAIRTPER